MTILNPLFEDQGSLPGTAAGWSFTANCPTVIVDPAGFCAGPGYPTLDGIDTGYLGSQFQMGREADSEIVYTNDDTFTRTISQTTGTIAEFANSIDVRFHKKLHADADPATWALEVWVAGILEHTEAIEPGEDSTVNHSVDVSAYRGTEILVELKLTQQAVTELGNLMLAGTSYTQRTSKLTSLSDPDGSASLDIGGATSAHGWAGAWDKNGDLKLAGWVEDAGAFQNAVVMSDVKQHPDGGWVGCGYGHGVSTFRFLSNAGATSIDVVREGGIGTVDTAFWCKWDATGTLEWAKLAVIGDSSSASNSSNGATSLAILDDGRIFMAGYALIQATGGGAPTPRVPAFSADGLIEYPPIGAGIGFFGDPVYGTWVVEIDPVDGEGLVIQVCDAPNQTLDSGRTGLNRRYINLVVGHDQTYILLAGNHAGDFTAGTSAITVGRGLAGSIQSRLIANRLHHDPESPYAAPYLARLDVASFTFTQLLSARQGGITIVANDNNMRGAKMSTPSIDAAGGVHFTLASGALLASADLERDSDPYASVDTFDAGTDKLVLVGMNEAWDKPSVDGHLHEAYHETTNGSGTNHTKMEMHVTADGAFSYVAFSHNPNAVKSVSLFGAASASLDDGDIRLAKINNSTGAVVWISEYSEAESIYMHRIVRVRAFEGGPRAGQVVALARVKTTNIQASGPVDAAGGGIQYDVGADWGAEGETNGDRDQIVLLVFNSTTGAVIPASCFTMGVVDGNGGDTVDDKLLARGAFS